MTLEEKQLLLKDLSARLPYGVIYHRNDGANIELREADIKIGNLNYTDNIVVRECKPYLRTMSSMTEDEKKNYVLLSNHCIITSIGFVCIEAQILIDWLNEHHFDYRGLIRKGLALEAPEDMYKI